MSLDGCYILEASVNHIESGLGQYIPLCGADLDPAEVDRVEYWSSDEGWEQSHEYFCNDCHSVANRRAVEGNGGALS
ncbi:hypothetical protein ACFQL1_01690 [Halomicroarcula sp. GCM10025709]|uniref:hypothetical protein n=1 Tax=Haloarcula TaxID=2237 RepID=UPI0024C2E98B|nr:hypothetical protein [Halomicroarcula sp. YJ-61-S]